MDRRYGSARHSSEWAGRNYSRRPAGPARERGHVYCRCRTARAARSLRAARRTTREDTEFERERYDAVPRFSASLVRRNTISCRYYQCQRTGDSARLDQASGRWDQPGCQTERCAGRPHTGQHQDRRERPGRFLREVDAQAGKQLTPEAVALLKFNTLYLLGKIQQPFS